MTESLDQIRERATREANDKRIPFAAYFEQSQVDEHWRRGYIAGVIAEATRDRWISVEDELPPIHEEPFTEDGFVLILFQCADWPGKWKTMKASRTIGDWADDGTPLWFWADEEGEIIDDDDNLITGWMPIPPPTSPTP